MTSLFSSCCPCFGANNHHPHAHPHSHKHQLRLSDLIISKPVLLPLTWSIMTLTVYLGRDAFLAHVFLVTFLLLIILYKINSLYGQFDNPHYFFYLFVMAGGVGHVALPIIGTQLGLHVAMYSHLCLCFVVHILHISQCYSVFQDIMFKDEEFIVILWAVNIAEMVVNVVFVFHEVFTEEHYVACSLATQCMALMIVNLNLQRNGSNSGEDSDSSNSSLTSTRMTLGFHAQHGRCHQVMKRLHQIMRFIDQHLVSRVSLMILASVTIALMVIFGHQRYLIFMITLSLIMRLAVRKVDKICMITSINSLLDRALMLAPVAMIGFAAITEFGLLHHGIGVSLTLVALIWGVGLMFFALYTITDGHCITVYIAFIMLVTSGTSSIIYLLQGHTTDELLLFACLTVSTSVLFFLSKIRTVSFVDLQKQSKGSHGNKANSNNNHGKSRVHPSSSSGVSTHPSPYYSKVPSSNNAAAVLPSESVDIEMSIMKLQDQAGSNLMDSQGPISEDNETKKSLSHRTSEKA